MQKYDPVLLGTKQFFSSHIQFLSNSRLFSVHFRETFDIQEQVVAFFVILLSIISQSVLPAQSFSIPRLSLDPPENHNAFTIMCSEYTSSLALCL